MHHILLCGGAGTRLWPLSNRRTPKQLLPLFDGLSLLQITRLRNAFACAEVTAIVNEEQAADIITQLTATGAPAPAILAEPVGRNTAAAIALAAFVADPEEILLITPADHLIGTPERYEETIRAAYTLAMQDYLVTIGLQPAYPETGYGYIQYKGNDVVRFVEKPDTANAGKMLQSGDYLWNSGIFCARAAVMLEELERYAPDIYATAAVAAKEWLDTGKLSREKMQAIPSNSIDYAVMEKSDRVKVVPSDMDWSDVGSYEALTDALAQHYSYQNEQAVYINSNPETSIVIGKDKLVALVGVENMVVVDTPGAILVMQKGKGQDVKQLHQWVKENRPELL